FCARYAARRDLHSFPTRRSSDLFAAHGATALFVLLWSSGAIFSKWALAYASPFAFLVLRFSLALLALLALARAAGHPWLPERGRSEEHTSELQSRENLVCRLLLE